MKIGILTLPLHTNYGGILQAYALQTVLGRMGHEVSLIETHRKPLKLPLWKAPLSYGKRILKNISGHPFPIFYEQKVNRETPVVRQYTDKFIDKYIKRRIVNNYTDVHENDFDAIIVGSDQIWRPEYFPNIETAYLDFTEGWNIKRVAYAASFGTDDWEYTPKQTKECRRLLQSFDAISVRENSGVDLCRNHFHVQATHVLDPTMMLEPEDYIKLFEVAGTPKSPGTLLNYILDETPEKTALIEKIAKDKGLVPFRVNSKVENINAPLKERIQPPVEQWLRGFYDAEFVITDSFHACVFSILFNKPFFVIGNTARGMSRFTSLLSMFGLKNRLIHSNSSIYNETNISWQNVMTLLNYNRRKSRDFLLKGLNVSNELVSKNDVLL